jgi:hypothetical protein
VLPWIHRVFALMKRWGLGTYHGLRRKHIDTYLNEFVFRYDMAGHLADHPRVVPVIGEPRIRSVPVGERRARQSPQRRADSPAPAAAPKDCDRHAGRRIKTSRKTRTHRSFGFDLPALDFD